MTTIAPLEQLDAGRFDTPAILKNYRKLRRISGDGLEGLLKDLQEAADQANWQRFVELMGGPTVKRKDCPSMMHH